MKSNDFKDKVTIITGGGSGIGEAMCKHFADKKAKVIILDNNEAEGRRVSQENKSDFIKCDISDEGSVDDAFNQIENNYGRIDILINNAGIAHIGKITETNPEDFDRIIKINVRGAYLCARASINSMIKNNKGCILNMASVASNLGIPDRFAYSTSKGAVYTMTLSVARDYVDQGIRCNCICPARVHTPFVDNYLKNNYPGEEKEMFAKLEATQPIGRMAKPEEIAALAGYICSDEAAFVTGSAFDIDGGFTLLK
ncbi:MAG: SDR family oxidoreductase [Verrucomicrobiota bacterium]|nr:SDR family oxidoreductase [Verrucomicrobiota bacterium]MEC8658008.1 SDR family oxidoreductase [Verrucomicrobiota bacterium]MEC8690401.1 SDR family oxidoreductase [Verrucomicrobiota bacterium]